MKCLTTESETKIISSNNVIISTVYSIPDPSPTNSSTSGENSVLLLGDFRPLKHCVVSINTFVKRARVNKKLKKGLLLTTVKHPKDLIKFAICYLPGKLVIIKLCIIDVFFLLWLKVY